MDPEPEQWRDLSSKPLLSQAGSKLGKTKKKSAPGLATLIEPAHGVNDSESTLLRYSPNLRIETQAPGPSPGLYPPHRNKSQRFIHPPPLPPNLGETQTGNKSGRRKPAGDTPVKAGNENQKTEKSREPQPLHTPLFQTPNPENRHLQPFIAAVVSTKTDQKTD